jgi:hypothetical protein
LTYTSTLGAAFSLLIWGLDIISPSNCYYKNACFNAGNTLAWTAFYNNFVGSGSEDLSTLTPMNQPPFTPPVFDLANANAVFAGPVSGGADVPGFRNEIVADPPTIGNWPFARTGSGNTTFSGADTLTNTLTLPGTATIVLSGSSDAYRGLISGAIAALPANGGIIDGRAQGVASVAQGSIDPGSKSVTILLGPWTGYTFTQIKVRSGLRMIGSDQQRTFINAASSATGALFVGPASNEIAAFAVYFQDLSIVGPGGNTGTPTVSNTLDAFSFDASHVPAANYPNASLVDGVWNRVSVGGFGGAAWKFLGAQVAGNAGAHQFLSFYDCTSTGIIGPGTTALSGLTLTAAANASGGNTVYTGTITGGRSNAYAGFKFIVTGFDLTENNGTFICTGSTATTLTLKNASGVSDTHAGTATAVGASPSLVIEGSNFQHFWHNSQINSYATNTLIDQTNGSVPLIYIGNAGSVGAVGNPTTVSFHGMTVQGRQLAVQFDGSTDVTFRKAHLESNWISFKVTNGAGVTNIIPSGGTNSFNSGLTVGDSSFNTSTARNSGGGAIIQVSTTALYGMVLENSVYNSPLSTQSNHFSPDNWLLLSSTPAVPVSLLNNIDVNAATMIYPANAPTTVVKNGTANDTNYQTTNTSPTTVDGTNLSYTVTIPRGWKLLVWAQGTVQIDSNAVSFVVNLTDTSTSTVISSTILQNTVGFPVGFSLVGAINGDGASHTVQMKFNTAAGADKVEIINQSTGWPQMMFLLTPSN